MIYASLIDGSLYISHVQLALFVFGVELKEKGTRGTTATTRKASLEVLTADIKARLVDIHASPTKKPMVLRYKFDCLANKAAVFALVEYYGWGEGISQPLLAALGEFGPVTAEAVHQELCKTNSELPASHSMI